MTPELVERVCVEVLGWTFCDGWREINFGSAGGAFLEKTCTEHEDCQPSEAVSFCDLKGKIGGVPKPDWNLAGRVIEAMRERGFLLFSLERVEDSEGSYWVAGFSENLDATIHNLMHSTPIEAVCRAALAALKAEK